MTLFNKQETALFLADGDFWTALSNNDTPEQLDHQLTTLYARADAEDPTVLYGTMPDDTQPLIGTSPRRPHRPE